MMHRSGLPRDQYHAGAKSAARKKRGPAAPPRPVGRANSVLAAAIGVVLRLARDWRSTAGSRRPGTRSPRSWVDKLHDVSTPFRRLTDTLRASILASENGLQTKSAGWS